MHASTSFDPRALSARPPAPHPWIRARRQASGKAIEIGLRGLSKLTRFHPETDVRRFPIEVTRDVAYRETGSTDHLLDVYRPTATEGPHPVVLYIHGGGFRILSKESHEATAVTFAREGYLVFNVNYRLAPAYPYPAALEDVCAALGWVLDHAAEWDGDLARLVLSGDSAGANLTTSLALAAHHPFDTPWARSVWERDPRPRAVVPMCGLLQVTDGERHSRRKRLPFWLADRLAHVESIYLEGAPPDVDRTLVDPLVFLEEGPPTERALPPFLAGVGTRDPLLDDSRRLGVALERRDVPCEVRVYPGEVHSFQNLLLSAGSRDYWRDHFAFLDRWVRPSSTG